MPDRIIDERTGEPCDYDALVSECRELAKAEEITWRQATERIAEKANLEKADSIVRNLNRRRQNKPQTTPFRPGEGVLYEAISKELARLEDQIEGLEGWIEPAVELYQGLAARAASIRGLLDRRSATLEALSNDDSISAAREVLGGVEQGDLDPKALVQEEHALIRRLLIRTGQLQNEIDSRRSDARLIVDHSA